MKWSSLQHRTIDVETLLRVSEAPPTCNLEIAKRFRYRLYRFFTELFAQ